MEMSDKEKCQQYLDSAAWLNDGHGLVIQPTMAKRLRAMGIEGPFVENKPLTPCTRLASMRY